MYCVCAHICIIYIYMHTHTYIYMYTVFLLEFKHVYSKDSTQKGQSGHERKQQVLCIF